MCKIFRNYIKDFTILYFFVMLSIFSFSQYAFAQVSSDQNICRYDGEYAIVAVRPLRGDEYNFVSPPTGTIRDKRNLQKVHEHIFYCSNRRIVDNIGFGASPNKETDQGTMMRSETSRNYVVRNNAIYKSDIMKQAVVFATFQFSRSNDELQQCDFKYSVVFANCQDFVSAAIREYNVILWSGDWAGILDQPGKQFNYSIKLKKSGPLAFVGTSRIEEIDRPQYFGVMSLKASLVDNNLIIEELKILSQNPPPNLYWCIKKGTLRNIFSGGTFTAQGSWSDRSCNAGRVSLKKR